MKVTSIAEAQPVGFAFVRRDSADHASMFLDEPSGKAERNLAALSVLAAFRLQRYNFFPIFSTENCQFSIIRSTLVASLKGQKNCQLIKYPLSQYVKEHVKRVKSVNSFTSSFERSAFRASAQRSLFYFVPPYLYFIVAMQPLRDNESNYDK